MERKLIISEPIAEWQLYIYAVPKEVQEWMSRKFPAGKYWHQHSLEIKTINAADSNGCLAIDFRKDEFSFTGLQKANFCWRKLSLIQHPKM